MKIGSQTKSLGHEQSARTPDLTSPVPHVQQQIGAVHHGLCCLPV
jgi:hypothetical protein